MPMCLLISTTQEGGGVWRGGGGALASQYRARVVRRSNYNFDPNTKLTKELAETTSTKNV